MRYHIRCITSSGDFAYEPWPGSPWSAARIDRFCFRRKLLAEFFDAARFDDARLCAGIKRMRLGRSIQLEQWIRLAVDLDRFARSAAVDRVMNLKSFCMS